jgi:hypothetical protein
MQLLIEERVSMIAKMWGFCWRFQLYVLILTPFLLGGPRPLVAQYSTSNGAPSDTSVDNGTHDYGSYDGFHENISVSSGNLSFCIPLVSLKGPNNHDLSVPLCYNSQFQEVAEIKGHVVGPDDVLAYFPWVWAPNTPSGDTTPPMGPGWTLTGAPVDYESTATSLSGLPVAYMPDGGRSNFPLSGGTGPDGQNADTYFLNYAVQIPGRSTDSQQTLIMKDGARYYISTTNLIPPVLLRAVPWKPFLIAAPLPSAGRAIPSRTWSAVL